jgi:DNA-directed RNA polymerase subunit RPC12/RpoP
MIPQITLMARERSEREFPMPTPIIAYPAGVPCPACGAVVQDWHAEWTDPAHGPDLYKRLRAIDCPLCGVWVLYKARKIQAVPAGDEPEKSRRLPLQAARWAKSQTKQGVLRGYLDQSAPGRQYRGYFTDQEIQDADADAGADPRY